MGRYFIYIAYNGKNYCGWQTQPNGTSIQQTIEQALSLLLQTPTDITGAGRTDAGVHAREMVAHFDAANHNPTDARMLANRLNAILPHDIAIRRIAPVQPDAHARFDALSRTYQYFITCEKDPFRHEFAHRLASPPDLDPMNAAARILLEYTDFTSFCKLHSNTKTNRCQILQAEWQAKDDSCVFTIRADRFLRNMVRAIVGSLLEVGNGKRTVEDFRRLIENKDRAKAGTSAPAKALFLTKVEYPQTLFETKNIDNND
jgi:tRNA pseudouridine38-40 synthase